MGSARRSREVEIVAAADGAPEAWLDGERAPVSLSLSHRAGRALAVVADAGARARLRPRARRAAQRRLRADVARPPERAGVAAAGEPGRARLANLIWTAKEAAAKVRREGLRLDVGQPRSNWAGTRQPMANGGR